MGQFKKVRFELSLKNTRLDELSHMRRDGVPTSKLWDRKWKSSLGEFGAGSGNGEGVDAAGGGT